MNVVTIPVITSCGMWAGSKNPDAVASIAVPPRSPGAHVQADLSVKRTSPEMPLLVMAYGLPGMLPVWDISLMSASERHDRVPPGHRVTRVRLS